MKAAEISIEHTLLFGTYPFSLKFPENEQETPTSDLRSILILLICLFMVRRLVALVDRP